MRSAAHIKGHPVHPMLIPFPFAYLLGSAVLDLWAGASRRPRWHGTARDLNTLGLASAMLAAVPGVIDYFFSVPPRSSGRIRATQHAIANLSAVGLFAAARLSRRTEDARPARWGLAAELAGASFLAMGGWLGGTLVVRNQIGVDHRYAGAGKWQEDRVPIGESMTEIDVGPADELQPDQMKLLRFGERRLVLARTDEGYVAFDDRCTHRGGPLSDGALICGVVQCPWHGSQYDVRTGVPRRGPAREAIAAYEVVVRDGHVWLRLESEIRPELAAASRSDSN